MAWWMLEPRAMRMPISRVRWGNDACHEGKDSDRAQQQGETGHCAEESYFDSLRGKGFREMIVHAVKAGKGQARIDAGQSPLHEAGQTFDWPGGADDQLGGLSLLKRYRIKSDRGAGRIFLCERQTQNGPKT